VFDLVKWGILIRVLPWAGLFCIAKSSIHWLAWEPWAFDALTGALFSAVTFVIALILSGTLSDYRACEGMPAQIANTLENIYDLDRIIAIRYPAYDPQPLQPALANISRSLLDWLRADKEFAMVEAAIDRLNLLLAKILVIEDGCGLMTYIHYISSDRGVMEIIVSKNRNGSVGTCKVNFDPSVGRFSSL
jgi:DnaB-like helicase C terminal domain